MCNDKSLTQNDISSSVNVKSFDSLDGYSSWPASQSNVTSFLFFEVSLHAHPSLLRHGYYYYNIVHHAWDLYGSSYFFITSFVRKEEIWCIFIVYFKSIIILNSSLEICEHNFYRRLIHVWLGKKLILENHSNPCLLIQFSLLIECCLSTNPHLTNKMIKVHFVHTKCLRFVHFNHL